MRKRAQFVLTRPLYCPARSADFDSAGHMYASDETQSRLYKIAPSGNMVGLTGLVGSQDGVGTNILLQGVSGLSVDSATGIVYIASTRETSARMPCNKHMLTVR